MQIVRKVSELKAAIKALRQRCKIIGLVPTMGAVHEGHLSLVDIARKNSDGVIATIFVNPAQFGKNEDLSSYPRDEDGDIAKFNEYRVDIVYTPPVSEIYPEGFSTIINTGEIGGILCGAYRPGHFDGVATIVTKLFNQIKPNIAVFGEKDYQQLVIIKKLVKDLDMDVDIIGGKTVREKDGLAISSRNRYLSPEERKIAPGLYKTMLNIKVGKITIEEAKSNLLESGFAKIDYIEVRDALTLGEPKGKETRLLAAAYLGKTRIIDNIAII